MEYLILALILIAIVFNINIERILVAAFRTFFFIAAIVCLFKFIFKK